MTATIDAPTTTTTSTIQNASCITLEFGLMWKRVKRRTFAPRRPAVFPEQWGLVLVTAIALFGGIALVVYALVAT